MTNNTTEGTHTTPQFYHYSYNSWWKSHVIQCNLAMVSNLDIVVWISQQKHYHCKNIHCCHKPWKAKLLKRLLVKKGTNNIKNIKIKKNMVLEKKNCSVSNYWTMLQNTFFYKSISFNRNYPLIESITSTLIHQDEKPYSYLTVLISKLW